MSTLRERRGDQPLRGLVVLCFAALSFGALASCDRAENGRVAADAKDAAHQAAAGLDHAAAEAQPVADRAAADAKRGVNNLAIAAGKATRKAGVQLEHAAQNAQRGYTPPAKPASN
jgi:hypothetical protein